MADVPPDYADDFESFLHTLEHPTARQAFGTNPSPWQGGAERIESQFSASTFNEMLQKIPELKRYVVQAGIPLTEIVDPTSPVMTMPALEMLGNIRIALLERWADHRNQRSGRRQLVIAAPTAVIPAATELDAAELTLLQKPRLLARYRFLKKRAFPSVIITTGECDELWNKPPKDRDISYLCRGWRQLQAEISKADGLNVEVCIRSETVQLLPLGKAAFDRRT